MPKVLAISSMAIAGLVLLVFLLDLVISIPFNQASKVMDIGAILAAAIIGYLGWTAYREAS
jgi:hypothetical protein